MTGLPMSTNRTGGVKLVGTRRPRCPTAAEFQDWGRLPALVDGVASPEPEQVLASAMQLEAISRRHPGWLDAYEATLTCVARLAHGETRQLLLATVLRLELSPRRRSELEASVS